MPREDKNAGIMQRREPHPREARDVESARPPYTNEVIGLETPPYHPIGRDALSPLLLRVEFPATREDIIDQIGQARIAISQDRTRTVADIMGIVAPESFRSSREVEDAVMRVWDQVAAPQDRGGRPWQDDNLSVRRRR